MSSHLTPKIVPTILLSKETAASALSLFGNDRHILPHPILYIVKTAKKGKYHEKTHYFCPIIDRIIM